jgi:hypothetical protein
MKKTVSISPKPVAEASADEWVRSRQAAEADPLKRLTIDLPTSLHTHIKSQCALRGVKMADEIRRLLTEHFGAPSE